MANDTRPLLEINDITLTDGGRPILQAVSLGLGPGECVTLIGPNGAGKTTLVRIILGLRRASSGTVWLRPGLRIGYMPQRLTVDETLPLTVQRFVTLGQRAGHAQVTEVLDETGARHLRGSALSTLSGGELQRVMLARALLRQPDLLVLDEPDQALDVAGQYELYDLLQRIRRQRGCGMLMVSHDLHLVMATTDRVVCLNGHVCCAGQPESVSRDPAYQALFGREGAAHIAVYQHRHDHRHTLAGEVSCPAAEDVDG